MIVNNNEQSIEVPISVQIDKKPKLIFGKAKQIENKIIVNSGDTVIIKWN